MRLVYISKLLQPLSEQEIKEMDIISKRNDFTGVLVVIGKIFFIEVIEGECSKVQNLFKEICEDKRYSSVLNVRVEQNVQERNFDKWTMKNLCLGDKSSNLESIIQDLFFCTPQQLNDDFSEDTAMQFTKQNKILEEGFDECFELTEAEKGLMFVWSEKEKDYTIASVIDNFSDTIPCKPQTLQSYMAKTKKMLHFVSLPIVAAGKTIAFYLLERNLDFNEEALMECDLVCLDISKKYESFLNKKQYFYSGCADQDVETSKQESDICEFVTTVMNFTENYEFDENTKKKDVDRLQETLGNLLQKIRRNIDESSISLVKREMKHVM